MSGMAFVGVALHRFAETARRVDPTFPVRQGLPSSQILASHPGLLTEGKSDFEAIEFIRDRWPYLVAMLFDYGDLRLLALHRMSRPKVLQDAARDRDDFDLAASVAEQQNLGFPTGNNIRLKLRVCWWPVRLLEERRLSADRTIKPTGEGDQATVTATVAESERLVWWLRSHGAGVEVLAPRALRKRLAAEYSELSAAYEL